MLFTRDTTTFSKLGGGNFLVWGYYALLQKKIRKVYPVWRSLLPPPKSYEKVGGPSTFWGGLDPHSNPQWLRPCYSHSACNEDHHHGVAAVIHKPPAWLETTSRKTQPHVAHSHWIGSETTEHRSFTKKVNCWESVIQTDHTDHQERASEFRITTKIYELIPENSQKYIHDIANNLDKTNQQTDKTQPP